MNCDEYLPLISGHLDGENSEFEERRLQEHLQTCEACRALLSQMEQNDALLKSGAAAPPADLTDRIMRQVRKEKQPKKSQIRRWIPVAVSGLAVAAMLSLVIWGNLPVFAPSKDSAKSVGKDSAKTEINEEFSPDAVAQEPAKETGAAEPAESAESDGMLAFPPADRAETITGFQAEDAAEPYGGTIHKGAFSYTASSATTLIVWNADGLNALADYEPEAQGPAASLTTKGTSDLYSRILAAIPLRDLNYSVTVYAVPYETMIAAFYECSGAYENAIYYPPTSETPDTCSVILINSGK